MEPKSIHVILDIKVGDKFSSVEEFASKLEANAQNNYVQFYRRDSRTVESAKKKVKRNLNTNLLYYSVKYTCIHGGREHIPRGTGKRNKKTLKNETLCPACVTIRIDVTGNEFEVIEVNNDHNHQIDKDLFQHLPRQRALPPELKAEAKKFLRLKANKHILRDALEKQTDKIIKLKDLSNLEQEDKRQHTDNIRTVVEKFKIKFGSECQLLIDEENNLKGIVFCTPAMKAAAKAYPEIICIDVTYTFLNLTTPVYLILVEDGNGESVIVCVGLLVNENQESLRWFLDTFIDMNPECKNPSNVMADKHWNEQDVLKECFPQAKLTISIFHLFRTFQREIAMEKIKINSIERNLALKLLQDMVFARNESDFERTKEKMEDDLSNSVLEYLEKHWSGICEEWCPLLGLKISHFMKTTNNRIEGMNAKLKSVISQNSTLEECLDHLFIILHSMEKEKRNKLAESINKRQIINFKPNTPEYAYSKCVTQYALKKIAVQLNNRSTVKIVSNENDLNFSTKSSHGDNVYHTTIETCSCYFYESMGLPCKHIFAVRDRLRLDLFKKDLVKDKWTINYILNNQTFFRNFTNPDLIKTLPDLPEDNSMSVSISENRKKNALTYKEKYKLAFSKCKLIASLCSETNGVNYDNNLNALDTFIHLLERNCNSITVLGDQERQDNSSNVVETPEIERDMPLLVQESDSEPQNSRVTEQVDNIQVEKIPETGDFDLQHVIIPPIYKKRSRPVGGVVCLPPRKRKKEILSSNKLIRP